MVISVAPPKAMPSSSGEVPSPTPLLTDARKSISSNADVYVQRLAEAVAIPSVSTDLTMRDSCVSMADYIHNWVEKLGGRSEKVLVGFQELDDGERFDLPPVVLAEFHDGPVRNNKPTLLVYGHYDVQPADINDGWLSDPFKLTERDGALYGRGSTDDKGPVLAWLWAIETFRDLSAELPVNVKLVIEGMEESDSECLQDLLEREVNRDGFLTDINYVVISDNYWVTPTKPCLTYGLRGLATFQCEVRAGSKTLHSGQFGGCIAEPMTDIIQLLAAVSRGAHDGIDIEGCARDECDPVSDSERDLYEHISLDLETLREEAGGVPHLLGSNAAEVLMNRWRFPALSIHGIEGGYSGSGFKTVIPGSATGKFSIRLVPGQDAHAIEQTVTDVLRERFEQLGSGNELTITSSASDAWIADPKGPLYQAGAAAILKAYGVRPDFTREGGSIPIVNILQKALGVDLMLMPIGASDDGAHSENEKINRKGYLNGINVLFALLLEIARVHSERSDLPSVRPKKGALGRLKDIWYGLS